MRISDWSSDVCSSDLRQHLARLGQRGIGAPVLHIGAEAAEPRLDHLAVLGMRSDIARQRQQAERDLQRALVQHHADRMSVEYGMSRSGRVDTGGPRLVKQKRQSRNNVLITYNY